VSEAVRASNTQLDSQRPHCSLHDMDLATDILNIVGKVSQVPLLDAVCELAIEIIKTVQVNVALSMSPCDCCGQPSG
jgi:hypothetical protein